MGGDGSSIDARLETLKRGSAALAEAEIPWLIGGSLAAWARGGPETFGDLDFMVKPEDADRALAALERAGMRPERPPERWLYKAWDGDVCIDLIFGPQGVEMTDAVIERGVDRQVMAVPVRVMALEDVFTTKLLALEEHSLDYETLLQMARALREQVDWAEVRERTSDSPFARAFFVMLDGLGVVGEGQSGPRRDNVRVITDPAA